MRTVSETRSTKVICLDEPADGNACHKYQIDCVDSSATVISFEINFQKGPIKEAGVNGIMNEDLIAIVIDRLRGFQSGPFACRENALTLTKLEEALMWSNSRTKSREARGVEGRNIA